MFRQQDPCKLTVAGTRDRTIRGLFAEMLTASLNFSHQIRQHSGCGHAWKDCPQSTPTRGFSKTCVAGLTRGFQLLAGWNFDITRSCGTPSERTTWKVVNMLLIFLNIHRFTKLPDYFRMYNIFYKLYDTFSLSIMTGMLIETKLNKKHCFTIQ